MSVLTGPRIRSEIKKGNIVIKPFNEKSIGAASIDLHLSNEFRIFKKKIKELKINKDTDYKKYTKVVKVKDFIVIKPEELVLGITKEKITLPSNICGWLQGRSRFARLGLLIHNTASFIQPGINNRQVLEIKNSSNIPIKLYAGTSICQIILEKTEGKAYYSGIFSKQDSI